MRFSILLPALTAVPAISSPAPPADQSYNVPVVQRDVVVIGGGSSGSYAAVRLTDSGKSVLVLERQSNLGGHADTWFDPDNGKPYNLGIQRLSNDTVSMNFLNRVGVEMVSAPVLSDTKKNYLDFSTGKTVPGYMPVPMSRSSAVLLKYSQLISEKWPTLVNSLDSLGFPVPTELLDSFTTFIERYGLQDLPVLYNLVTQIANVWEVAMVYVVMALNNVVSQQFQTGPITAKSGDNQEIFDNAADIIGTDNIVYQVSDMHIFRQDNGNGVLISYNSPDGNYKLVHAKKILITVPPTIDSLKSIGLDTQPDETAIFQKLHGQLLGSAVVSHPALSSAEDYYNISPDNPYNLQTLPGSTSFIPVATGESNKHMTIFIGLDPTLSEDEIRALLTQQVNNVAAGAGSGVAGEATIHFINNHSPMRLHVGVDEIRNGFYKDMHSLQGKRNTFWTGDAWATHYSSSIWERFENSVLPKLLADL